MRSTPSTIGHPSAFVRLEPRHLLAQTFSGTDTDGDLFTIKLSGPGTFTINDTPSGSARISALSLASDTTLASTLTISVTKKAGGDGRLRVQDLLTQSDLGALNASTTDIADGGQVDLGRIRRLTLGDLSANAVMNTALIDTFTLRDVLPNALLSIGASSSSVTSITLRNLGTAGSGADLACTAFIKTLSANTFFGDLFTVGGKDIAIVADAKINFEDPGSAQGWSSIKAKGNLELSGDVQGPIKSISAGSLFFNDLNAADIATIKSNLTFITGILGASRINTLSAKTSLSLDLGVLSIGAATAGTQIADTNIRYRVASPSGFAIDLIKAPVVGDLDIAIGGGGSIQKIKTIDVGSWTGGSIRAVSIDTIKVKGDFDCTSVNLSTEAGQTYSIKSMTVGGALKGQLDLASDLIKLKAATAGTPSTPFRILDGNNRPVDIGSIELTGSAASNMNIEAKSIVTVKAKHDLKSQMAISGSDLNGVSLGAVSARELRLIVNANGGVNAVNAKRIVETVIVANFITTTNITGGDGLAGEFFNSLYTANGINSQGFSIKSFTAKGAIDGATFRAATRIGTVTADAALGMIMFAGRTDGFGFPATLSGFDPFGRIDAITLKRKFTSDPQNFAFLDSAVCAPSIGTITINGRLDTEMGSSDGFGAKTFGKVTLKDATGTTVKPIIPTSAGDFDPFINNGDFIFRVYA